MADRMKSLILNAGQVREVQEKGRVVVRKDVKPRPVHFFDDYNGGWECATNGRCHLCGDESGKKYPGPLGKPGDRVWVKETLWRAFGDNRVVYAADVKQPPEWAWKKVRSTCMKREQSRLTLEIAAVAVEKNESGTWQWVYDLKKVEASNG